MSTAKPTTPKPPPTAKTNKFGLLRNDYKGGKSTLCTGCGHDSISNHIITSYFQSSINPYKIAKMSGIGCSSKTPAYFINKSHGFNSMHGRMAPVTTGAKIANSTLHMLGVSGDGDTASIGVGGFIHLIRRNLPMVYIVANNGVYGLTKGQFSATAEMGSVLKNGTTNPFSEIDICELALTAGCGFVARSFSGDAKQMVPILSAAIRHQGTAVIDVISPCITFNNHDGSTKSFNYVKEHDVVLQELGFYQAQEEITVDYEEGTTQTIELPDGSHLVLKKLCSQDHDLGDKMAALQLLEESKKQDQLLTGLFHIREDNKTCMDNLNLISEPLATLPDEAIKPSKDDLINVMKSFK